MKKTQAFLVIGFIVTVALSIGFFMQLQNEKHSKLMVENLLSAVTKEKDMVEITMNKKLQEKERMIAYLSAGFSKEKSIRSMLTRNLERSAKKAHISNESKKPVELEKIIISSLLETEGRVLAVDKQNDLVVINLGSLNDLKNGDKLSIYRGDNFIANAELVKVQDKISAAMLISADNNAEDIAVEVDDIVK